MMGTNYCVRYTTLQRWQDFVSRKGYKTNLYCFPGEQDTEIMTFSSKSVCSSFLSPEEIFVDLFRGQTKSDMIYIEVPLVYTSCAPSFGPSPSAVSK